MASIEDVWGNICDDTNGSQVGSGASRGGRVSTFGDAWKTNVIGFTKDVGFNAQRWQQNGGGYNGQGAGKSKR
jgi:hypothetical protein